MSFSREATGICQKAAAAPSRHVLQSRCKAGYSWFQKADDSLVEKQRLLELQRSQLQKTRAEIERVYRLYQDGQFDSVGFGKFYKPLEDRTKELEADLPRLQAEIDVGRVHTISAEEIVSEAQNLHRLWPNLEAEEKRKIVEAITEKIVVGKDEIDITLCYLAPCEDMAKRWRKGWDSNPRYGCPYV